MDTQVSPENTPPDSPHGSPKHRRSQIAEEDPTRIWDDLPKHLKIKKRSAYIRRHSDLTVTSNYRKFTLLMWKNYINTKRKWKTSTAQLTAPAFLITILVIINSHRQDSHYEQRIYDPFKIDVMPDSTFGQNCETIYLKPHNKAIEEFKDHLQNAINACATCKNFKYKFSDDDLDVVPYKSDLCAMIEFIEYGPLTDANITSNIIRYHIRFPGVLDSGMSKSSLTSIGKQWDTSHFFPPYLIDGPREIHDPHGGHPGYYQHGFLYIQHLIAMELAEIIYIKEKMKRNTVPPMVDFKTEFAGLLDKLSVRLRRFPFPSHRNEGAVRVIHDTLPVVLVTGFGISCMIMVYLNVHEKEMGIRILLKMYGIDQTFHRYAWILHNLIMLSLSSLLITAILATNWTSDGPGIFNDVASHVFLLLIVCYVFCLICTVLLIVCFFSRASTACISVCFIWTVTFVPYIYVRNNYNILEFWQRIGACLFFNTGIAIGCHIISEVEALDEGLNWNNVFSNEPDSFSLGWVMITMVLMGFMKFLLAQYLAKVFPDSGIQSLPWNFLFTSWFWNDRLPPDDSHIPYDRTGENSFEENHPEYFEDDSNTKRRKELTIENVSKYHGKLRALHKMNLICHQGHVTVVLGDQGSGKSSLLQMLNGTMAPSSGTISLSRKDLYKNPIHGRAFVGYCPPQDLLFPDLTVDETLQFFTELKGLTNRIEAYEEVERFLRITLLADYRDTRVCDLTKSSQRMLMVASAFCGGSRVVLLDEPTANLSAAQQRVLWDFTGQEKKHRTILVAMDLVHEVDTVVDKIVLLHYGQMTCKGSPEFLKNKFGGGYHLEIESERLSEKPIVETLISRRVNGSRLFSTHENVLDFYLPQSQTASFPGLLEELETSLEIYGIKNFKMKFVTLEELHLRLKRQSAVLDDVVTPDMNKIPRKSKIKRRQPSRMIDDLPPSNDFKPTNDKANYFREFQLMFMKNVRYTLRKNGLFVLSTCIPFIMLIITHLMTISFLKLRNDLIPHVLNYSDYRKPEIVADIYKSTNEGFYMRDSVKRRLSTMNGFKQKDVNFHEDIVTEVLNHYKLHHNENDIPNLGIEIFPVRETVTSSTGMPSSTVKVGVTGYFNNQPLHTSAVAVALIDNILMDYIEDKIRRDAIIYKQPPYVPKGYYFNVSNHPLNYQPADVIKYSELFIGPGYIFGICAAFSYSFLIASFIIMHIDEQEFRHLQMVAGANKIIFWASNYLWNIVLFSILAGLHMGLIALFWVTGFTDGSWVQIHHLGTTFIFILIYGISAVCIVGSYATHSFMSWGRGFSKIALIFLITGPLVMLIMIPLQNVLPVERWVFTFIHNILLFLPPYGFGTGLYYIVTDQVYHIECDRFRKTRNVACDNSLHVSPFNEFSHDGSTEQACCFNNQNNAFSFVAYGVGRNLFTMGLVIFGCIAHKVYSHSKKKRMIEKKALEKKARKWRPLTLNEHEVRDYDVLTETAKIYRGEDSHEFTIRNFTVESPLYVRVDNMCLEIPKGECFALLGSIGSGKTIFLKTLCGYPGFFTTYGDVELHGLYLNSDYDKYISYISYCPDHNPFLFEMSGQEVLELIGTCRKIPWNVLERLIDHYTTNLGFKNEIELPIKGYSHVHAKKLSVAAALLGKFEVLMLDEPLHHLDPKSRQFIISSVKRLMDDGCIVIWTAHSIEQCESICTKMSILVNGSLRCIGSLPHLRGLYEEGYTVIVRFVLDKDMIYFTSKKNIRMEHELREEDVEDEVGATVGLTKQEARKKTLTDALGDMELALSELAPWEQDLCPFVAYFERAFPDSILVDKQPGFIHYHVNQSQTTWSTLFRKMEEAKTVAEVDSYYVACTNLDQVFFNFTRGQITLDS